MVTRSRSSQQSHCAATRSELINAALHTNINFNTYQLGYCKYIIGVVYTTYFGKFLTRMNVVRRSRKKSRKQYSAYVLSQLLQLEFFRRVEGGATMPPGTIFLLDRLIEGGRTFSSIISD